MHLTALDFAVIIVYMVGLALIGLYFSKRQTSREEYFLGGRGIHWFLAGGSLMATLLSTITYLSVPGEMIRYGIAYFGSILAIPLIIPVTNRVLIPILMRLPITSAYEYLEKRFDVRVRSLASFAFIGRTILWMGLIIYTASFAFAEMSGWNIYVTIVAIGLITTFYTTTGGLRTVVWTDNLQLFILFGGAVAIPFFIAFSTGQGPFGWWETFSQAGRTEIQMFSWDLTVRITVFGVVMSNFFWNIATSGGDQVAVQRYLSTPSLKAARRTVWVYTFWGVFLSAFLMLCGLALFAFYAQKSGSPIGAFQEEIALRADRIMPQFIVQELPAGISGLLLAALLAAAMSSLSSGINSISGVVMNDFLQRFGFLKDSVSLKVDKLASLAAGLIGIGAAIAIALGAQNTNWNLVELTGRINHIFVAPIAVLFFGGILFRRTGSRAVLIPFFFGTLLSLFICFGKSWFGLEENISFIWVVPIPFIAGLALAGLLSTIFRGPQREKIQGLTIGDVLGDKK